MSISEIHCADDIADLAREAVQQVRITKQYRDLISAVLMANHVADWYYGKSFGAPQRDAMKARYPEWDAIRKIANGTKHCKKKAQANYDDTEWEDSDYWESTGHVGDDGCDWFIDFGGQRRSVVVLIETFLKDFSDQSSRPSF